MSAKITRLFSMEWARILAYRADALLWLVAEAAIPLIAMAVWYTVANSNQIGPTPQDILTYYILIALVKIATDAWAGIFLARYILNGEIVKFLVRPLSVFWQLIANNTLEKAFRLSIPAVAFTVFIIAAPHVFSPQIFITSHILLFSISLLLGIILSFISDIVIGEFAFWLEDAFQLRRYKFLLESVASGLLVPFAVMPDIARTIFSFLPFRYILSLPVELLLGQVSGTAAFQLIGIQCLWIVGLLATARIMWTKGLQRYAPPGQ